MREKIDGKNGWRNLDWGYPTPFHKREGPLIPTLASAVVKIGQSNVDALPNHPTLLNTPVSPPPSNIEPGFSPTPIYTSQKEEKHWFGCKSNWLFVLCLHWSSIHIANNIPWTWDHCAQTPYLHTKHLSFMLFWCFCCCCCCCCSWTSSLGILTIGVTKRIDLLQAHNEPQLWLIILCRVLIGVPWL